MNFIKLIKIFPGCIRDDTTTMVHFVHKIFHCVKMGRYRCYLESYGSYYAVEILTLTNAVEILTPIN